jgi:hypothetical protein
MITRITLRLLRLKIVLTLNAPIHSTRMIILLRTITRTMAISMTGNQKMTQRTAQIQNARTRLIAIRTVIHPKL